eukprot:m.131911 g.131911  ORF g.131911 m.131911 type:complete len:56 (+) comp13926_c0_seq15:1-168(+)
MLRSFISWYALPFGLHVCLLQGNGEFGSYHKAVTCQGLSYNNTHSCFSTLACSIA